MSSTTFVILSFAISHGIPLALAVRELLALGKPSPRGDDRPPPEPEPPRTPKPLPDCLLPRPAALPRQTRTRMLEDA